MVYGVCDCFCTRSTVIALHCKKRSAADRKLMKFLDGGNLTLVRYTPFKPHSSTGEIQSP